MQQYFAKDMKKDTFILETSDLFHIEKVMRMKENEKILVSYENKIYDCHIIYNNKNIIIKIDKEMKICNEIKCDVTLVYGLPKGDKLEFVIQKATELGVSEIVPFAASRSVINISKDKEINKLERWNRIAKEASEQSKRNKLVKVNRIADLEKILDYRSKINIIAYEDLSNEGCNSLLNLLKERVDSITIVVGPEGGFEEREIEYLVNNDFKLVSLGKRILRSETAPLFLLSVIGFLYECNENI